MIPFKSIRIGPFDIVSRDGYGYSRQPRSNRLVKNKVITMISWVKYIARDEKDAYERLGWTIKDSLAGTHHDEYSPYIGTWRGGENEIPPIPEKPRN